MLLISEHYNIQENLRNVILETARGFKKITFCLNRYFQGKEIKATGQNY